MNLLCRAGSCFGLFFSRDHFALFATLLLPLAAFAAPALNVTPSSLAIDSASAVTLHVTGLAAPGETILIERYLDVNANGAVDAGDRLAQSSRLTDGAATLIGGQPNRAVPADDDATADGQISMHFSLTNSVELARIVGGYLIRVSSPTAAFGAFTQPFTVTQTAETQSIAGTVTSDGMTPVPHSVVGLLVAGDDGEFLRGVVADASGHYTINAPAGGYQLIPVAPGFLADLGAAPEVALAASATVTSNITMVAATRTISGRLENSANSALGLPAVQLFVQSEAGLIALPATDANGDFSVGVTASAWQLEPASLSLAFLGYVGASGDPVDTTTGSVTGHVLAFDPADALLHGTVTNSGGAPLAQVFVQAQEMAQGYELETTTDALGRYSFGVRAGDWDLRPDSDSPGLAGYVAPSGQMVSVATGQAVETNFAALATNAHLVGTVTNNGSPVPGLQLAASLQNSPSGVFLQTVTDGGGNFDLGVVGGTWGLQLENSYAAENNLVGASLSVTVADNATVSGIAYTVKTATGVISGQVADGGGAPVADANIFGFASIGGVNYSAGARTDGGGNYSFPVIAGTWTVGAHGGSGLTFQSQQAVVSGATTTVNFAPLALTAHFQGTVTNNGVPVAGVVLGANLQAGGNLFPEATTNGGGAFDLAVTAGTWNISVRTVSLDAFNLVAESLGSRVIADNQTVGGLALRVQTATGAITGTVRDYSGAPAAGVFVSGNVTVGGVNYAVFAQTNVSGQYSLRAIDGTWTVNANSPSLNFAARTLAVSGSASADFMATVFSLPPFNQTVTAGATVGFNVQVNAPGGAAALQWQLSTNGGSSWSDVPAAVPYGGTTTNSLGINPAGAELNGTLYRCVASGSFGMENSSSAVLTVNTPGVPPSITADPVDRTVSLGQNATFSVSANGTPAPAIQWQLSTDDGFSWTDADDDLTHSGVTTGTLTVATANVAQTGDRYRALATNTLSSATSGVAILTLSADFNFWRATYFTPTELANPSVSGPTAIYGVDGLPNLTKYALGLNPTVNATTGLPEVTTTATEWVYTYTRPSARAELTYAVEISTNLTAWTTSGVTHELVSSDPVAGTQTWRARYPLASAANVFFRLKVTQ